MSFMECQKCGFFFSSRRRHTRWTGDWSSDVCSSDLRCRVSTNDPCLEDGDHPARLVAVRIGDAVLRPAEDAGDADRLDLDAGLFPALALHRLCRPLARID